MKYNEFDMANKEALRERVREYYNLDIAEAECHFSSRNYAFIFPDSSRPSVIRVGVNAMRTRHDLMSELMWTDDLSGYIRGISAVVPADNGKIEFNFTINGTEYYVSRFKKAAGGVMPPQDRDSRYYYNVGRYLAMIHNVSCDENRLGIRFSRFNWYEKCSFELDCMAEYVNPDMLAAMKAHVDKCKMFPQNSETYGMIHGDFTSGNIFVNWDDIAVFDFDDCCYGYYMYDIAVSVHLFLFDFKAHPEGNSKGYLANILKPFREGYESTRALPEDSWEQFYDFMRLRMIETMVLISQKPFVPENVKISSIKTLSGYFEAGPDYLRYMDKMFAEINRGERIVIARGGNELIRKNTEDAVQ